MKIFDSEKGLGVDENTALSFTLQQDDSDAAMQDIVTLQSRKDIYVVRSILVSTTWNLNDDIFDPAETWAAKDSPKFKQTNIEHDEEAIVGNIIDSWVIDDSHKLIEPDTLIKDLPELYHLLVASVIYRQWKDPELIKRAEDLITQIQNNEISVSMECKFNGFDYGVVAPDGKQHIVARTKSTAFLSQYLKAYGGSGWYQNHRVGRLLRNFSFKGEGFTENPANKASVIFDKDKTFAFAACKDGKCSIFTDNGVDKNVDKNSFDISSKESDMSVEILNDQIKELKDAVATLTDQNKSLNDKLAEANTSSYEDTITSLKADVASLTEQIKSLNTDLEEAKANVDTANKAVSDKSGELQAVVAELDSIKCEAKASARAAKLVEIGLSDEEAAAKNKSLAELSDEQFEAVVEALASVKPVVEETDDDEDDVEASKVIEEDSQADKGSHSVSGEEDSDDDTALASARQGIQKWVEECICK